MKFDCETLIAVPRGRVIELLDDPANLVKWQTDLLRFEPISGDPGQAGSKSRLVYKAGNGEFEMIETITDNQMPNEFTGTYATKMGVTTIRNRFIDRGASTQWIMETSYAASGVMKLIGFMFNGMMRKQTQKMVASFKAFAEASPR